MIATLTGKILMKSTDNAVVDVGGVGYEVFLSHDGIARLPDIGDDVFLHIHTNVREDAITLFGFLEEEEREMFRYSRPFPVLVLNLPFPFYPVFGLRSCVRPLSKRM